MTTVDHNASCVFADHRRAMLTEPPQLKLDGGVLFRPAWSLGVPASAGLYFIHDLRGVLYLGRASQLRRRFVEHYECSHNGALNRAVRTAVGQLTFSWMLAPESAQPDLERELIRSLRPLCNVQHNTTRSHRCA